MAQQDKISILGPRRDGTYVVEFKTAAGKNLSIKVPEGKTAVLKEFQLATAELHAPTPDEGVMISLEKPEIRNVLKITWTVVRGLVRSRSSIACGEGAGLSEPSCRSAGAGSGTLDNLERCRVFRPLIDHLV